MLLFAVESTTSLTVTILALAAIPILVCINGFFVAAEFALVSMRKTRVEELVTQGVPRSLSLMDAITELDRSVAAAQLGITLASLALGLVSEPAIATLIEPLFGSLEHIWAGALSHTLSIIITLGIVTYLHVVFGEQMPKIAALQASERVSLWISGPINLFARITRPLIRLMNGSSFLFLRWIGFKPAGEHSEVPSVDELQLLIEDTEEAGMLDSEAADYLYNVFALSTKKVRDVMIPWNQVMALELMTSPERVLELVREGAHTRMPVFSDNHDNIVGIVNTKDLFYLFSLRGIVVLEDAIAPPQFLDPDMPVSMALRQFRRSHRHMAVVRDTAGKTLGLITLEDILEEIVGDIEDEHDDPTQRRQFLATYLKHGKV